jgi:hypothetical protein
MSGFIDIFISNLGWFLFFMSFFMWLLDKEIKKYKSKDAEEIKKE